jgi:hypothetical protein
MRASCALGMVRAAHIRRVDRMERYGNFKALDGAADPARQARLQQQLCEQHGLGPDRAPPFLGSDTTAGTENELVTAVAGPAGTADLACAIADSPHAAAFSRTARSALTAWLRDNPQGVWEHSWLRLARARLHPRARELLERELAGRRDRAEFEIDADTLRLPASHVLRLALADAHARLALPAALAPVAERMLGCFLNDNTAPEVLSTHIVSARAGRGLGTAVAHENAQRFLLVQLLAAYANSHFGLEAGNQTLQVYGAPNPPARLRQLSRLLPADFYRELFMNPCLAGFSDGVAKRGYMHLCHATLSRSRQHAHARLIGAGIARAGGVERLVCDTSLLNNGTHLSLGSRQLSNAFDSTGGAVAEKYLGDLAAKLVEHFLPLFVGLYSAAPVRLAPADLRPEQALGFLPNEISAPFLRLTWQSWKRKAGLLSGLKGDFVPDARLLDYYAALPGLPGQAALDGRPGNGERLKSALAAQGLYSPHMTVYALYRLREQARMGFSGFEGRHYSLFASFADDLAPAASLQAHITALAYRYIAAGEVTHAQIPDDPETESERRQLFFAAAIGLPVAYVRRATRNRFLLKVLAHTRRTRLSKRHPQYFKVYLDDYRQALAQVLAEDGAPLRDAEAATALAELRTRLAQPQERGAAGSITRGILTELGEKTPMDADAATFNHAAENYYRDTLRTRQLAEGVEACSVLLADTARRMRRHDEPALRAAIRTIAGERSLEQFVAQTSKSVVRETAGPETLRAWIGLVTVNVAACEPD